MVKEIMQTPTSPVHILFLSTYDQTWSGALSMGTPFKIKGIADLALLRLTELECIELFENYNNTDSGKLVHISTGMSACFSFVVSLLPQL